MINTVSFYGFYPSGSLNPYIKTETGAPRTVPDTPASKTTDTQRAITIMGNLLGAYGIYKTPSISTAVSKSQNTGKVISVIPSTASSPAVAKTAVSTGVKLLPKVLPFLGGTVLGALLFGKSGQQQQQDTTQTTAPQDATQKTDPILVSEQKTYTYSPQSSYSYQYTSQYAPVTTEIIGRDIWAYLSPYTSLAPTQKVTPSQTIDIKPAIEQAVKPLQQQLQELMSKQGQEATQTDNSLIWLILAGVVGFFLLNKEN